MVELTLEHAQKLFDIGTSRSKEDYQKAKRKYRKLAKQYHPDAGGTTEDFQIIQQAWSIYENSLKQENNSDFRKSGAYRPTRANDRNPHILFRELIEYLSPLEGKHIALLRVSEDLSLTTTEYMLVEEWLTSFQKMRYILGNKVNFIPPGLSIQKLEDALEHVEQGNYGAIPSASSYDPLPVSFYRQLAKGFKPKKARRGPYFDFDLEDWEKEGN